jgi:hypothetical protein
MFCRAIVASSTLLGRRDESIQTGLIVHLCHAMRNALDR